MVQEDEREGRKKGRVKGRKGKEEERKEVGERDSGEMKGREGG